ncbi:hypothetical protein BDN70DRAFT_935830 [Pholiota conissans]|uniref:Uncharacterized protein n=1 Tax=Pholiota conissans TaxID=109636 RepID=A0A9P5YTE8_9AGAR|nr:hypothetical protein BDN70DRAFT_935830 [Pholiota conissans]
MSSLDIPSSPASFLHENLTVLRPPRLESTPALRCSAHRQVVTIREASRNSSKAIPPFRRPSLRGFPQPTRISPSRACRTPITSPSRIVRKISTSCTRLDATLHIREYLRRSINFTDDFRYLLAPPVPHLLPIIHWPSGVAYSFIVTHCTIAVTPAPYGQRTAPPTHPTTPWASLLVFNVHRSMGIPGPLTTHGYSMSILSIICISPHPDGRSRFKSHANTDKFVLSFQYRVSGLDKFGIRIDFRTCPRRSSESPTFKMLLTDNLDVELELRHNSSKVLGAEAVTSQAWMATAIGDLNRGHAERGMPLLAGNTQQMSYSTGIQP